MAILDLNQAAQYITALTGDVNTVMTWQVFYDPKDGTERPDLATHFQAQLNQITPLLERAETNLCGVYVCINPTTGGRFASDVTGVRALFADFDGIDEPAYPIKPHLVTRRDATHGHAYWLVEDVQVDNFMYMQRRIATRLNTDIKVTDPSRVARVPGTAHLKNPQAPAMYTVCEVNDMPKYTGAQILDAFVLSEEQQAVYDKWTLSREAKSGGTGFDNNEFEIERFVNFITDKAEPAQESVGSGGTGTVIKVCSLAHDLGIELDLAKELAWQHYNPRCLPPWGEHERSHFEGAIERAYQYARNTPGCRTTLAAFEGIIIPPAPVKDGEDVIANGDRLNTMKAKLLSPVMNGKSTHYELAQVFDGIMYDGRNMIRADEIFYQFNGKSWKSVGDKYIKSQVQKFYARLRPSDTLVRGVLNSFMDMVTVFSVNNGTWVDTGKSAGNILSFNNGLVDLTDPNRNVLKHTPNYFSFNELEYDFMKDNVRCDLWLKFLQEIWDDDQQMKDLLQEWFGYCLASHTDMQKFAIFIGVSRGGKGVIAEILTHLVGKQNTAAPSLSRFNNDSTLHHLSTSKLALIPDAHSVHPSKRDEVLANLKAITGGDSLDYHVMYKGAQTSSFTTRIVMSTNNMPQFLDASGALVNRMLLLKFDKSFAGKEDYTLADRLKTEIAGIAQWALIGLQRLNANRKFTVVDSVASLKESVREDMNPLAEFVEDRLTFDVKAMCTVSAVYATYRRWCDETGIMALSKINFGKILKDGNSNIEAVKQYVDGKQERVYLGVMVNAPGGLAENIEGS
tara:strand:+ start:876 stop:3254 length:2379 start_codon:yes stop_codon:yes gene_type:complete